MARRPSPTLLVLREIRDELRAHTRRLDALVQRQAQTEVGLATELVRPTEQRVASIEPRVERLELHTGLRTSG